jgi:hypothetical protein
MPTLVIWGDADSEDLRFQVEHADPGQLGVLSAESRNLASAPYASRCSCRTSSISCCIKRAEWRPSIVRIPRTERTEHMS